MLEDPAVSTVPTKAGYIANLQWRETVGIHARPRVWYQISEAPAWNMALGPFSVKCALLSPVVEEEDPTELVGKASTAKRKNKSCLCGLLGWLRPDGGDRKRALGEESG